MGTPLEYVELLQSWVAAVDALLSVVSREVRKNKQPLRALSLPKPRDGAQDSSPRRQPWGR